MKTNRRYFITTAVAGGLAAALPMSSCGSKKPLIPVSGSQSPDYSGLNEIEKLPVLKKEMFTTPVIIETLDLLRFNNSFLCRVRSKDGAEGISLAHSGMSTFYPIFINSLQRFFIGKDARDLDSLMDQVYIRNYRMQGQCLGIPAATIEFAILDMLGRIVDKPIGKVIGEIHNPRIEFYLATEGRGTSAEETLKVWLPQVIESKAREIKIRIGGAHMTNNIDNPQGRTEKLIPLFRKTFGDKMFISADSNGSYTVDEAIRVGKLLEEYGIIRYEEPVPYDYYEETKRVADALSIPVSGGEQEQSFHQFRWMLANDGLDIAEPDCYYFGGMIRSTKIARIAEACGKKQCTPHMSNGRLGFLYMLHFVSTLPNAGFRPEFKGFDTDVPYECKTGPLKSEDGVITVPTGPGSGVDIDPGYIKKHVEVNKIG
jgi:L-alanine-DL-glutamate epimerase-like enolase superfamily enzyme